MAILSWVPNLVLGAIDMARIRKGYHDCIKRTCSVCHIRKRLIDFDYGNGVSKTMVIEIVQPSKLRDLQELVIYMCQYLFYTVIIVMVICF